MSQMIGIRIAPAIVQEIPVDRATALLQSAVNFLATADKEDLAQLLVQVELLEDGFADILNTMDALRSEQPKAPYSLGDLIREQMKPEEETKRGLYKTASITSLIENFYDLAGENDVTEYTHDDFNSRITDQLRSAAEDLEDGEGASFDMTDLHFDVDDDMVRSELNQAMHRVSFAIVCAHRERDERNILDALNMIG